MHRPRLTVRILIECDQRDCVWTNMKTYMLVLEEERVAIMSDGVEQCLYLIYTDLSWRHTGKHHMDERKKSIV